MGFLINGGLFALYWWVGGANCRTGAACSVLAWGKTLALIVGGGTIGFALRWRAMLPRWCWFLGIGGPVLTFFVNVLTLIAAG